MGNKGWLVWERSLVYISPKFYVKNHSIHIQSHSTTPSQTPLRSPWCYHRCYPPTLLRKSNTMEPPILYPLLCFYQLRLGRGHSPVWDICHANTGISRGTGGLKISFWGFGFARWDQLTGWERNGLIGRLLILTGLIFVREFWWENNQFTGLMERVSYWWGACDNVFFISPNGIQRVGFLA